MTIGVYHEKRISNDFDYIFVEWLFCYQLIWDQVKETEDLQVNLFHGGTL